MSLEDADFYPQDSGHVFSSSGNEVFDPKYKYIFEFGDYRYTADELTIMDSYTDADIIRAIEQDGSLETYADYITE
jgi:hypothetical protein